MSVRWFLMPLNASATDLRSIVPLMPSSASVDMRAARWPACEKESIGSFLSPYLAMMAFQFLVSGPALSSGCNSMCTYSLPSQYLPAAFGISVW